MDRKAANIFRGNTSRGVHIRALAELLANAIADCEGPSPKRVALRDHLAALTRAYPKELAFSEVDLMQALAEEDGDEVPPTI